MVAVAIGGAAVIGGVTSAVSGSKAAKAQKNAAQTAAEASSNATELQVAEAQRQYDLTRADSLKQYDTARADYEPYRTTGYGALNKLAGMYGVQPTTADSTPSTAAGAAGVGYSGDGGFTASPGYAFRRDEGIKATERSAAARGSLASGGTMKAITRYADGLASSEYDTYASRLAQLAGVGQSATGSTTAAGSSAYGAIAGAGAQASGTIAGAYGANGVNQANAATAAGNARASSYANIGSSINGGINNLASAYLYSQNGGFNSAAGLPSGGGGFGGGQSPQWSY